MKNIKLIFILMLFIAIDSILFLSCKRNTFNPNATLNSVDSIPSLDVAQIKANISVQVFDANQKPLALATVICGNTNFTTDTLGYALFQNVAISQNNAAITVKKDGYFSCTRTFVAEQDKWHFLKVVLDDHTLTTTIPSDKGGLINMPSGASVNIPGNAMVLKGTNTVYNGQVSVYTHWLDPSSPNLMNEIQGDLRGIDTKGVERAIQTFGMVNVELKGANNEDLQLGENQQSTISFPISASLQSAAPAIIPLWYFSETNHRWIQQGQATKNGSFYTGTVQHFTCWNVDYPKPYKLVKCKIKILTPSHDGCFNKELLIHESGDIWGGHGYTDQDGYLNCSVPAGTSLKLDILGCALSSKSYTVGPYVNEENTDSLVLSSNEGFTIKGSVFDCSGLPLKNGFVRFNINGFVCVPIVKGNYKINYQPAICNNIDSIYFYSVDLDANKFSSISSVPANKGSDITLNMKVCNAISGILIGSTYQGGIVIYNLQQGDSGYIVGQSHGLIAATSDQGKIVWCNNGLLIPTGAIGTLIGSGLSNTNAIITAQGATAINYAAGLAKAYSGGGYADWYLPNKEELNKLYLTRTVVGGIASEYYWSSSEFDSNVVWSQDFRNGVQAANSKNNIVFVRAIRAF